MCKVSAVIIFCWDFYFVVTINFEQTEYTVNESSRIVTPLVILKSDVLGNRDIIVEVFSTDRSATGDYDVKMLKINFIINIITGTEDYQRRPYSLLFTESVNSIPLIVFLNNDEVYEGNEDFILTIDPSKFEESNNIIVDQPNEVVVVITDHEDGNNLVSLCNYI